jgi:NDP-sugar pyrophosphorylase family protein
MTMAPEQITAAVLIGGLGTRLRDVVADRPKALAPIRGRPFLAYLLDWLSAGGVREAVLCTGFLAEQVRAELGDQYGGLRLRYSQETAPLGTGGALRLALPQLNTPTILALNGDSYCEADLAHLLAFHEDCRAAATLLLSRQPDCARFGRVEVGPTGAVERFEEKRADAGPGWINAGVYCFTREFLASIPAGKPVSLEREVLPGWIGHGLFGYCAAGSRFIDIGTPESYRDAEAFFSRPTGKI